MKGLRAGKGIGSPYWAGLRPTNQLKRRKRGLTNFVFFLLYRFFLNNRKINFF